jgi:hypothetical protein
MNTESITQSIIEGQTSEPAPEVNNEPLNVNNEENNIELKPDNDLSRRLAIIAKKEKALMQKQQEHQQKMKDLEEKYSKLSQWEELDKLAQENPSEFFKKKGLSFEQIQQKMLESMPDDEIDPIQKQLKELQSKLAQKDDEYKKLLDERFSQEKDSEKQKQIEEQSKHYAQELNSFIETNKEEFDLVNTFGASQEVFNVVKEVYLRTAEKGQPKLLDMKEACALYEKKLEEQVKTLLQSNKVKKLLGTYEEENPLSQVLGQFTIDDTFTATSANSPELKTEAERVKAAAKLFESQFKQL